MRGSCTSSSSRAPPSKALRRSATSQVRHPVTQVPIDLPRPPIISIGAAQFTEFGSGPGAAIVGLASSSGSLLCAHEVSIRAASWGEGAIVSDSVLHILQRNPWLASGS